MKPWEDTIAANGFIGEALHADRQAPSFKAPWIDCQADSERGMRVR